MVPGSTIWRSAAVLAIGVLAGCEMPNTTAPSETPKPPARESASAGAATNESFSAELAAYYTEIERRRRDNGLMRREETDGVPVMAGQLARDFVLIALRDEGLGDSPARRAALRRWERPVRLKLHFGDGVGAEQRAADTRDVNEYVARLARVTGHSISVVTGEANFHVLVLGEGERRRASNRLRELVPGVGGGAVRAITEMPRSVYCLVAAFARDGGHRYTEAVAVVRAEHPDLTRLSCYHEEIAQGLGLPNDSAEVRQSIFNDREEYALLTRHDELLLRMLYDERLEPGMTEAEARPIIEKIAAELTGPQS